MAHFLPWYTLRGADYPLPAEEAARLDWTPPIEDLRHWNDARAEYRRTHLRLPHGGIYDSRDPARIEWQIATAAAHGVDGFLLNWYGVYSVENVITLHWLQGLQRWNAKHSDHPFLYFFCHDMQAQWPTEGKRPVSLEEDFRFIREHLIRPGYLCRDGRPVFAVFPYGDQCAAYRHTLDRVFPDGADLIWCGPAEPPDENAAFIWVAPDEETIDLAACTSWRDPDNCGEQALAQFYGQRRANGGNRQYLMGGVWPGFNDTLVRWAWNEPAQHGRVRPRVICRHTRAGSTLERTWAAYLNALRQRISRPQEDWLPIPLVQLITWNDYAEDSALEPTLDDGFHPLELCLRMRREAATLFAQLDQRTRR